MLDATLTNAFIPGSILRGEGGGANWLFLLPSLDLNQVVCIGIPDATTLMNLSRFAGDVVVACASTKQRMMIRRMSLTHQLTNIRPAAFSAGGELPLARGSVDLVLVMARDGARRPGRDQDLASELQRLLKPQGLIYFDTRGSTDRLLRSKVMRAFASCFGPPQVFWLTPVGGEMQTAVPVDDRETICYFLTHRLDSPWISRRALERAREFVRRLRVFKEPRLDHRMRRGFQEAEPALHPREYLQALASRAGLSILPVVERGGRFLTRHSRAAQRHAALIGCGTSEMEGRPPMYLRSMARSAGLDLDDYRWGLFAPGEYNSRKALFLFFDRASGSLDYIVKLVRNPVFNPRLENEFRALTLLREKGVGGRETTPEVLFFGYHAGLALICETAVPGLPLRQQISTRTDSRYALIVIDWLTELGAATVAPAAAGAGQVAQYLNLLLEQYVRIYHTPRAHQDFLAEQIAMVARSRAAFPLIFQHGDCHAGNILITPGGRAAFVDWERAEPEGMPLWDLFYFLRVYSAEAARARGSLSSLQDFARLFLDGSHMSPTLIECTGRFCDRTGLAGHLVEPLFYTCWMYWALREATRLRPAELKRGIYARVLRMSIEQRNAPTLRRLFSLAGACAPEVRY